MFDFTGETFNELESFLFSHSFQHLGADRRRDHSKLIFNSTEPGNSRSAEKGAHQWAFPMLYTYQIPRWQTMHPAGLR